MLKKSPTNSYVFYFDDTGIGYPDHKSPERDDHLDWFCHGGILVSKEDESEIVLLHKFFCNKWEITSPLHSTEIRGNRDNFGWLKGSDRKNAFFIELNSLLITIPVLGFGVVVSRQGYNKRFKEQYGSGRWQLSKTTYPIMIERVVRFLLEFDPKAKLRIVFEGSTGRENRNILEYARTMKQEGSPFGKHSDKYSPLTAEVYSAVISGLPKPGTKANIFLQIADLYIYPMVKRRSNSEDRAWVALYGAGKVIDAVLKPETISQRGIKYYCFE